MDPVRITISYKSPIHPELEDKLRDFMQEQKYELRSGCTVGSDPEMRNISFELEYAVSLPKQLMKPAAISEPGSRGVRR